MRAATEAWAGLQKLGSQGLEGRMEGERGPMDSTPLARILKKQKEGGIWMTAEERG